MRASLQREVRTLVKKYGPELGSLYFDDDVQWDLFIKKNITQEDLFALTAQISAGKHEKPQTDSYESLDKDQHLSAKKDL